MLDLTARNSHDAPTVLGSVQGALVEHFHVPAQVSSGLELHTDHGPQDTGSDCATLWRRWRLDHTLAPLGRPTGNAVAKRTNRTLKVECPWLIEFESLSHLQAALDAWRVHFRHQRPHQSLGWQTPSHATCTLFTWARAGR